MYYHPCCNGCSVESCVGEHFARGFCRIHYHRWKRHGDPNTTLRSGRSAAFPKFIGCTVEGCDAKHYARGYCNRHYRRWQRHGDPDTTKRSGKPLNVYKSYEIGDRAKTPRGYVLVKVSGDDNTPSEWKREHRVVMEQYLGRELQPEENVHHLNGQRDDNRVENLELWNTAQPAGKRIDDLVQYARYVIDLYGRN